MRLILIVGATFGTTTIARYLLEMITSRAATSITKLACATTAAVVISALVMAAIGVYGVAAYAMAGLGGATILHRLHRFLGAMGDYYRMVVLSGSLRRQLP